MKHTHTRYKPTFYTTCPYAVQTIEELNKDLFSNMAQLVYFLIMLTTMYSYIICVRLHIDNLYIVDDVVMCMQCVNIYSTNADDVPNIDGGVECTRRLPYGKMIIVMIRACGRYTREYENVLHPLTNYQFIIIAWHIVTHIWVTYDRSTNTIIYILSYIDIYMSVTMFMITHNVGY